MEIISDIFGFILIAVFILSIIALVICTIATFIIAHWAKEKEDSIKKS